MEIFWQECVDSKAGHETSLRRARVIGTLAGAGDKELSFVDPLKAAYSKLEQVDGHMAELNDLVQTATDIYGDMSVRDLSLFIGLLLGNEIDKESPDDRPPLAPIINHTIDLLESGASPEDLISFGRGPLIAVTRRLDESLAILELLNEKLHPLKMDEISAIDFSAIPIREKKL